MMSSNPPVKDRLSGGPCRIRTHVSGSEGRKDIQTTLIAQTFRDGFPFSMSWLTRLGTSADTFQCEHKEYKENGWNKEECKRDVTENVSKHTLRSTDATEMESILGPGMAKCDTKNG